MKKENIIISVLFILTLFIISLNSVIGYTNSSLKMYYSMESTNASYQEDSINDYNLTASANSLAIVSGKIGNAINWSGTVTTILNTTAFDFSSAGSYTANFWLNPNNPTNTETYFTISNGTANLSYIPRSTALQGVTGRNLTTIYNFNTTLPTGSIWSMITIVYSFTPNLASYYLNGVFQKSVSFQHLYTNSNKFILGGLYKGTIDEFSVWDTSLTETDILQLYNSGSGLNYSQTINNFAPPLAACIDSLTYCSNSVWDGTEYVCNSITDILYCSDGCSNSSGTALCSNLQNNSCNIIGESQCYDSTSRQICEDSDGNGYLDFGNVEVCAIGTYCVNQFHASFCNNVTTSGEHEVYGMIVTPEVLGGGSSNETSYYIDALSKTVTVDSMLPFHIQAFYTSGVLYLSRVCNYIETLIYTNPSQPIINYTTFISPQVIAQDSIVKISFYPNLTELGQIYILSQLGTTMSSIEYKRNSTAKSVCINYLNGTSIYCDYDYSPADSLTSVDLEYTFNFASGTYTLRGLFNRFHSNTHTTYPMVFFGNDIYTININATNTTLNNASLYTIPTLRQFTQTYNTTVTVDACMYTSLGNRKVRTYGNQNAQPDYSTYSDYNVNIRLLGASRSQLQANEDSATFIEQIPIEWRYVILIVLCFLALLFPMLIAGRDGVIAGISFSAILSLALTIIFKLSLLLPIIYIIIGGGVIAILIKTMFTR